MGAICKGTFLPLFLFRQREKAAEKEKLKKNNGKYSVSHTSHLRFFWVPFLFKKGCEAERCLWQMQRGAARAKQGESKRQRSFDYALHPVNEAFNYS